MFRLIGTATGVAVVLIGLVLALYMLPEKAGCCKEQNIQTENCKGKDHHCDGKKSGCEGKETHCVKEWKDADGKMHKEVRIEIRGDGDMKSECGGHGEMRGGCQDKKNSSCEAGGEMPVHCCCCTMMMQMHGGMMDHCKMEKDSMVLDTSVRIKIRSKL